MKRVQLIDFEGEEFNDLVGAEGDLYLSENHNWFNAKGRDFVTLVVDKTMEKDDKVCVYTLFGNIFVFKEV